MRDKEGQKETGRNNMSPWGCVPSASCPISGSYRANLQGNKEIGNFVYIRGVNKTPVTSRQWRNLVTSGECWKFRLHPGNKGDSGCIRGVKKEFGYIRGGLKIPVASGGEIRAEIRVKRRQVTSGWEMGKSVLAMCCQFVFFFLQCVANALQRVLQWPMGCKCVVDTIQTYCELHHRQLYTLSERGMEGYSHFIIDETWLQI